ncbi:hypothetical protein [Motiliproteus sp. MSK22-1]|uniref:hypothetical protein n=1 Tax=Motiliproteus sp. MSK22-1 TaxID=1897630 RepID=UPI0009776C3A|nr:hypothetical protein [Motiliproteus sp. MSK22-1]OMH39020.1 hypothetical protein BGP75_04690 [Motiliproteus sp. MSK22-1]
MFRFRVIITSILLLSSLPSSAQMSQELFNFIVNTTASHYQQEFLRQQQKLSIVAAWHNDNIYANAWKMEDAKGETGLVQISGGFARHPYITADAFALILCHEVGHHIAGPPKIWKFSAEGQADYFAASDCLRKLFRQPEFPWKPKYVPRVVRLACIDAFEKKAEQLICARIALAGASLAGYFAQKRDLLMPLLARQDNTIVEQTTLIPASPQCRLDTYFAAALCNSNTDLNSVDRPWLCHSIKNRSKSNRPPCWFKETAAD